MHGNDMVDMHGNDMVGSYRAGMQDDKHVIRVLQDHQRCPVDEGVGEEVVLPGHLLQHVHHKEEEVHGEGITFEDLLNGKPLPWNIVKEVRTAMSRR